MIWSTLISTGMKIKYVPLRQRVRKTSVLFLTTAHKSTMISKGKCNWKKKQASQNVLWLEKRNNPHSSTKMPHPENQLLGLTNFLSQALPIYRYHLVPRGRSSNRKWHLFLPSPSPYQRNKFLKGNCKSICIRLAVQTKLLRTVCSREGNRAAPRQRGRYILHHRPFWTSGFYILCTYYLAQLYHSPDLTHPLTVWHKHHLVYEHFPARIHLLLCSTDQFFSVEKPESLF